MYNLYYVIFNFILNFLSFFIKEDKNLILFVCYGGKKYDDSPRFVYEYIKNNKKFLNKKMVWAFKEPFKFENISNQEKVKIDTLKYYLIALKAKYWITNSSVERGLGFKRKYTKYVVFQHGTLGIKKIGKDITENNKFFRTKNKEKIDMFIIQGSKEEDLLIKALSLKKENIYKLGLPRNDELVNLSDDKILKIKEKLLIPLNKKVILYAPTFREYNNDKFLNTVLSSPFNFEYLKKELGNDYVFLFTAHYEIAKLLNVDCSNDFVINVFDYPYINDLLLISDLLISDYSSVVFDYCILERPILCFGYDYDTYMKERGTYLDLNKFFSHGVIKEEKELVKIIKNLDFEVESNHTRNIKNKFIAKLGNSTKAAVDKIFIE